MKQLFIVLSFIGSTLFSNSYAAAPIASPAVMQAFQSTFYEAKEIRWEQVGVLSKATFVLNGEYRSAFYNSDGDLVAETQNLASTSLPKTLRKSLKNEMASRWITDVFVVSVEGDNTYYVTLENADTSVMLKSVGAKKWATYKVTEK